MCVVLTYDNKLGYTVGQPFQDEHGIKYYTLNNGVEVEAYQLVFVKRVGPRAIEALRARGKTL